MSESTHKRVRAFVLAPEVLLLGGCRALAGEVVEVDLEDFIALQLAGDVARADDRTPVDVRAESRGGRAE